jgi:hypothetical protein
MSKQRAIRIPDELDKWILDLSPKYGKDPTNRIISMLYIAKESIEHESDKNEVMRELEQKLDQLGDIMGDLVAEKNEKYIGTDKQSKQMI